MDKSAIIKKAQKYTAQGDIDKAIAEWQKLLADDKDGNIHNVIGDLYLKKRDKENAIEAFKKAADFFRKDGFYLKAIAIYKKILNIDPSDILSLIALGELNAEKGLIGTANEYFLAAAEIFTKEGSIEKVLDIYKKMLSFSPSDIPLKIKEYKKLLGSIYLKGGIKDKAWEWLSTFIEELILLKKWDEALELLGNFSGFNPIEVKRHIISIYNGKGDNDRVIKEMLDLAGLYEGNGLLKEALQLYEDLLELAPSLKSAREKISELRKTIGEEIMPPEVKPVIIKESRIPLEESIPPHATPNALKEGLEEAEFYIQQDLKDEAINIYEGLLSTFPDDKEIAERLRLLKYSEGKKHVKTKKDRVSYI
ncbi:MAG: tetratricopeptide repeat protein [Nitrospirae bacterium]|nr:tetratricopeptide repeat protein [Nitrospirota bacterium]